MVFDSPLFLFAFLPLTLLGYYLCPPFLKNVFLLITSLFFYSWGDPQYVLFIVLTSTITFLLGIVIDKAKSSKLLLSVLGVSVLMGTLIYFKYAENIIPPLGISFITFRLISYVIDVYKEKTTAEKNVFNFLLYTTLFPIIIAGPIVRYVEIQKELVLRRINSELLVKGVERFMYGLGKKVIIANPLGVTVNNILSLPSPEYNVGLMWLAMSSYMLQIYFDFSGYSDMAIGLGNMFGFEFKENFNYPYISKSIKEFWQRWHISLSSWFRDYVYIPLGGNRVGVVRQNINILIVFLLTGIWHGSTVTFVLWGVYYGILLVLEKLLWPHLEKLHSSIRQVLTIIVVFFGWILFRAENISQATLIFRSLFDTSSFNKSLNTVPIFLTNEFILIFVVGVITSTPFITKINFEKNMFFKVLRLSLLTFIFIYALAQIAATTHSPFIYFRF